MDRVLIVEDDKEIARIIRYYLSQDNLYEVVSAASAEEALFLARDAYDIILLDVGLPDQSGIDLCAQLRQWHDCPILFISCLDDSNTIISALQQGGDDYIVKPFDNEILHARIQANLRRWRNDRQQKKTVKMCIRDRPMTVWIGKLKSHFHPNNKRLIPHFSSSKNINMPLPIRKRLINLCTAAFVLYRGIGINKGSRWSSFSFINNE